MEIKIKKERKKKSEQNEEILSEELKKIFEGDEENDLTAWGYRDYWPIKIPS